MRCFPYIKVKGISGNLLDVSYVLANLWDPPLYLAGAFKDFSFSPLPGEMIQFDEHIFQMG